MIFCSNFAFASEFLEIGTIPSRARGLCRNLGTLTFGGGEGSPQLLAVRDRGPKIPQCLNHKPERELLNKFDMQNFDFQLPQKSLHSSAHRQAPN